MGPTLGHQVEVPMTTMKMPGKKTVPGSGKITLSAALLIAAIIGCLIALWVTFEPLAIQ